MAKRTNKGGDDIIERVIRTIDESEKAVVDAVRKFVESLDDALPGDAKGSLSARSDVVEKAFDMIEKLLGVSTDVARRVTDAVRQALPEIDGAAAPAKKSPAKKAPVKKAPAKKARAKKAGAKKAPAKKA